MNFCAPSPFTREGSQVQSLSRPPFQQSGADHDERRKRALAGSVKSLPTGKASAELIVVHPYHAAFARDAAALVARVLIQRERQNELRRNVLERIFSRRQLEPRAGIGEIAHGAGTDRL